MYPEFEKFTLMKQTNVVTSTSTDGKPPVICRLRWSKEEKLELKRWLESGWDWHFPGYKQAAMHINKEFGNNRTPTACRMMDKWIVANGI